MSALLNHSCLTAQLNLKILTLEYALSTARSNGLSVRKIARLAEELEDARAEKRHAQKQEHERRLHERTSA